MSEKPDFKGSTDYRRQSNEHLMYYFDFFLEQYINDIYILIFMANRLRPALGALEANGGDRDGIITGSHYGTSLKKIKKEGNGHDYNTCDRHRKMQPKYDDKRTGEFDFVPYFFVYIKLVP